MKNILVSKMLHIEIIIMIDAMISAQNSLQGLFTIKVKNTA